MGDKLQVLESSKYYNLIRDRYIREKNRPKILNQREKDLQTKKWCTFYRRNVNLYASERLRVRLYPFQHVMLYLMSVSNVFMAICSRGLAKSWIVALYAVCTCLLKPYSEVVITSSTIDQANKIVSNKIEKELIGKLSPVLKWMYDNGLIKITYPKDCAKVEFFNKSTITVMPALDSSRGERATLLIAEECRLIKKTIWDSVFVKMAHPRQSEFLTLAEYNGREDLLEECQEVYITSAYFKSEWFWRTFLNIVDGFYNDSKITYNFFAGDIFTAIKHGLKTMTDLRKAKKDSGELEFRMEDLNEMIGEAENSYFSLEMFRRVQSIKKAFKPPNVAEYNSNTDLRNRIKSDKEKRLVCADLSFTKDVANKREEADSCVIECISCIFKDGITIRNLEYIETHDGGDDKLVMRRIREIFFDYNADYIVLDLRNGGELYYNHLTTPYKNPFRNVWDSHGLTLCLENDLQVAPQVKLEELRERTVDKHGIPCIIPVQGSTELNSNMWKSLWKSLNNQSLRLLIDEIELEQEIEYGKFMLMTSEEKRDLKLPYVQTGLLINEGINLSQSWNNGVLKLTQPRSGHKDRMTTLQYGNYICDKIENKYAKSSQQEQYSYDDWAKALLG